MISQHDIHFSDENSVFVYKNTNNQTSSIKTKFFYHTY